MSRTSGHPERIVPAETEAGVVTLHLARYAFAVPLVAGGRVLDAACGVGYGSAYLAEHGSDVLGIDIDEAALAYARVHYAGPRTRFERMDVCALELPDASVDAVCSFETIEHLDDPERAIAEAARVLQPDGVYVLSTPHVEITTHTPANPHHRVELSRDDLERTLRAYFGDVEVHGQRRRLTRRHRLLLRLDVVGLRRRVPQLRRAAGVVGSPATTDVTPADVVITPERIDRATELVVVCRNPGGRSA